MLDEKNTQETHLPAKVDTSQDSSCQAEAAHADWVGSLGGAGSYSKKGEPDTRH